jgi:hypothetical protein
VAARRRTGAGWADGGSPRGDEAVATPDASARRSCAPIARRPATPRGSSASAGIARTGSAGNVRRISASTWRSARRRPSHSAHGGPDGGVTWLTRISLTPMPAAASDATPSRASASASVSGRSTQLNRQRAGERSRVVSARPSDSSSSIS